MVQFSFAVVTSDQLAEVHTFFLSCKNEYIFPRSKQKIATLIEGGNFFAIRRCGIIVGCCYLIPDYGNLDTWEFGGLMVSEDAREGGVGTVLARLVLAYAIGYLQVLQSGKLICHVHADNRAPRKILETAGFEFRRQITVPAPDDSIKQDENRMVTGDEFEFTARGVREIAAWLRDDFREKLPRSNHPVEVNFGPVPLSSLMEAVQDVAEKLP